MPSVLIAFKQNLTKGKKGVFCLILLFLLLRLDHLSTWVFVLLLFGWGLGEGSSKSVPHASHEYGTEQILQWNKWGSNSQNHRRYFEIHKEKNNAKVDEWVWNSNKVETLTEEDNGCDDTGFGGTEKSKDISFTCKDKTKRHYTQTQLKINPLENVSLSLNENILRMLEGPIKRFNITGKD